MQGVRGGVPARGGLRVRAVLRAARGGLRPHARSATRAELRRRIQAGPNDLWRYADFLPLAEGPPGRSNRLGSRAGLPAGATPLIRADRLAEHLGLREVWVKNDAANPTHSFKDRVVAVAAARARELGFGTLACASTGNLSNAVGGGRRRARPAVLRLHPGRPRGAEDPRDRRLRREPRRGARQLRRRQPALHRALRRARGLGVREHQHAARTTPRARRRSRSRSSSSSAGSCPTAASCRSRRARCSRRSTAASPSGSSSASSTGAPPVMNGAQADRLRAGRERVRRRRRLLPAGQAGHDREVARDREPGGRPLRARSRARDRRLDRRRRRRRDPRGHRPARAHDRDLHRDRRRRQRRGARPSWRGAATSTPTSASCS